MIMWVVKKWVVKKKKKIQIKKKKEYVQSSYSGNCIHRYNVEILNILNQELQLINTKPMIKKKLKELLNKLKKFKVQTIFSIQFSLRL